MGGLLQFMGRRWARRCETLKVRVLGLLPRRTGQRSDGRQDIRGCRIAASVISGLGHVTGVLFDLRYRNVIRFKLMGRARARVERHASVGGGIKCLGQPRATYMRTALIPMWEAILTWRGIAFCDFGQFA